MRLLPVVAITLFALASCVSNDPGMSESVRNAKVDSLVAIRIEELSQQAMEDLDRRRSIEVKAKADSIVQAWRDSAAGRPTAVAMPISNNSNNQ